MTLMPPNLRPPSPSLHFENTVQTGQQLSLPTTQLKDTCTAHDQVVFGTSDDEGRRGRRTEKRESQQHIPGAFPEKSLSPAHSRPTSPNTLASLWKDFPAQAAAAELKNDINTGILIAPATSSHIASNTFVVTFTTKNKQIYTISRTEDRHRKPLFIIKYSPYNYEHNRFYWKLKSQSYDDRWHGGAIENMVLKLINPKTAHMEVLDTDDKHLTYSRGNPYDYQALYPLLYNIKEILKNSVDNPEIKVDLDKLFGPDKPGITP
jgi:hypothetical protein